MSVERSCNPGRALSGPVGDKTMEVDLLAMPRMLFVQAP